MLGSMVLMVLADIPNMETLLHKVKGVSEKRRREEATRGERVVKALVEIGGRGG